ncbi:hypothetical protein ATCV1_z001L [Acanthocystis turfacea chlorella virus 1]|uniref:Uncharacterized protein z001L n=1 Tax=Chlorovirus heliozoae TaxID=322019 RepID=A7K7W1_9PHYC|nr:hypothetical protein ATCV1_z001L [Acanthocystis turfacea chlorella virus 1]ABT16135.1 hypothetical protein ATCV1_z001L [Acanthocystis turfacea chlorella virus 1]
MKNILEHNLSGKGNPCFLFAAEAMVVKKSRVYLRLLHLHSSQPAGCGVCSEKVRAASGLSRKSSSCNHICTMVLPSKSEWQ